MKTAGDTYCIDKGPYASFCTNNEISKRMQKMGFVGSNSKIDLALQAREHLAVRSLVDPACRAE